MTNIYHIKDDGTPGQCRAKSPESCPRAKAGNDFHGSKEEATIEAEKILKKTFSTLPTVTNFKLAAREKTRLIQPVINAFVEANRSINWAAPQVDIDAKLALNQKAMLKKIASLYEVSEENVRSAGTHIIVTNATGQSEVYGATRENSMAYLGVLDPKFKEPVKHASEHKFMIDDREATDHEIRTKKASAYGYATVVLSDGKTVSYTTDIDGKPVNKQIWAHINNDLQSKILSDPALARALATNGIIKM